MRAHRGVNTPVVSCRALNQEDHRCRATGRARRLTQLQYHRLKLLALRDRVTFTRSIADQFFADHYRPIKMQTVDHNSSEVLNLRPTVLLLAHLLLLAVEVIDWNTDMWNKVIFSDESTFWLVLPDERARISVKRHVHHTVGIRVWETIAYGTNSPLVFIKGNMTAERYIQEVV